MKEYIKMFQDLQSANGYIIKDIPFIATASGETPQNVHCNLENKKIDVDGQGNISIVDDGIPNDEIWYTSSDGNIVTPYSTSSLPTIVSNTYVDGKGIIKFATNVINIGGYAFKNRIGLTSVIIPNGVTSIGDYVFSNCTGLTSVTISNSVISIGTRPFNGCTGLISPVYNAHLFVHLPVSYSGEYAIPDGIESIAKYAFSGCSSLTSVTIGSGVTSIGDYAFRGCSSLPVFNNIRYADSYLVEVVDKTLTSYTIKDGTKWIGGSAFESCTQLTSIEITNGVTSIGYSAFNGCRGLTSITIPNSVTGIGSNAFTNCTNLTSINIPNSVTSIEGSVFYGCDSLPVINNIRYADTYLVQAVNKKLTSYTIKDGTKWIGGSAFESCTQLTSIEITNGVTSIGYSAFNGCRGLTSITIPNSVTGIGSNAFTNCTNLTSINIPNSVTSIESGAFRGCSQLRSFVVAVDNLTYYSEDGVLFSKDKTTLLTCPEGKQGAYTIPNSVTSIREKAFQHCSGLASATISDSVTSIGDYAFYDCTSLTSVTIPNSVISIGIQVFFDCSGLTSVVIPNSVTSIGSDTFLGCSGLASVTIGNGVTSIGSNAFNGCSGLTSVTIPNSVTSIGYGAFIGCDNAEFYYAGTSTQWHNAFDNVWAYDSFPFDESIYIHCLGDNVDVYVEQPEQPFCCFVVGTKVQLPNNVTKNIEDIAVGNSVISYNPTTDELCITTVKNIIIHENTTTLARVTLANGSVVEMNEYHPILTRQGWHSITNYEGYNTLVIGDEVKTLDGYSKIVNIERWINEPITTYNLDVVDALGRDMEYDNYFANDICVHNPPPCAG